MGRMTLLKAMLTGGRTVFARSPDMSTFFEDMRIARPTEGLFPPRIINMLHDRFQEQLAHLPTAKSDEERQQQRQVRFLPFLSMKPLLISHRDLAFKR